MSDIPDIRNQIGNAGSRQKNAPKIPTDLPQEALAALIMQGQKDAGKPVVTDSSHLPAGLGGRVDVKGV